MQGGHTSYVRVAQALVDVQGRYVGPVPDEAFAGEDEVEVQVDQDAAEAGVGGLVDLGEGVVEQDQAGGVRGCFGEAGEVCRCGGEEDEVGQDALLALAETGAAGEFAAAGGCRVVDDPGVKVNQSR